MNRLVRGEKGYVLIAALLVLLVLGLISGPLLSYMVSGLRAGHVFETGAAELYAADAGVEDAVLRIPDIGLCVGQSTNYPISDVNGKSVTVFVESVDAGIYKITSIAVTTDGGNTAAIGSSTTIEAYVTAVGGNYSGLLDNVITSLDGYTLKGNVTYPEGNGPYPNYPPDLWPPAQTLRDFYWPQVKDETFYNSPLNIDLAGSDMILEAGYVNGAMTVTNSDKNNTPTLTLNGTLYIKGQTQIYGPTGKENEPFPLTIDLNGKTIFVDDSTVGGGTALDIKFCNVRGPGVIIAIGDIFFAPKAETGADAPIFVMSVLGETKSNPQGSFYGAIAGNVTVTMQPGTNITYPIGGFGSYNLNFPTGAPDQLAYSITSWQVSRQ